MSARPFLAPEVQRILGSTRRLVALALVCIATALPALASHFRYGHLSWTPVAGTANTADFAFRASFRRSGYFGTAPDGRPAVGDVIVETIGGTGLQFGDGGSTGTLRFQVTSIDLTRDLIEGIALDPTTSLPQIRHTYTTAGPFAAAVTGCCRINNLSNNPADSYRVGTSVDFSIPGSSPVSALPAIVFVQEASVTNVAIPGADADPNTILTWRFGTTAEAGTNFIPMPGLTINGSTGVMTWDTTLAPAAVEGTLWMCHVVIEDRDGTTGALRTQVSVDFIIEIGAPTGMNNCPSFDAMTPCGQTIFASVGVPVMFMIGATDADVGDTVTLNVAGLPASATLTPSLPTMGNPVFAQFSWTPGPSDVGVAVITFTAQDSVGCQTLCGLTINVSGSSCFVVDFETEDDLVTPLHNGQAVGRADFGTYVRMGGAPLSGAGAAIFDTTPAGPNAGGPDPDLLVGLGNCLILQRDPIQTIPGTFDTPNDDERGGRMGFYFLQPVTPCSIDLIDIDASGTPLMGAMVTLIDGSGFTRTYVVPDNWTEDIAAQGGAGYRTLDLRTLSPQPGFGSTATVVEQPGFEPTNVRRILIGLGGSGGVDNLRFEL